MNKPNKSKIKIFFPRLIKVKIDFFFLIPEESAYCIPDVRTDGRTIRDTICDSIFFSQEFRVILTEFILSFCYFFFAFYWLYKIGIMTLPTKISLFVNFFPLFRSFLYRIFYNLTSKIRFEKSFSLKNSKCKVTRLL
jgi:hypothetical protein